MNEYNPYAPASTQPTSNWLGIFAHAATTVYAFLCLTLATFIAMGVAILHPSGLNLLPNASESVRFLITAIVSLSVGTALSCVTWYMLRSALAGTLAAFVVITTIFTFSLVIMSLLIQIEVGNFSVIPQEMDSLAPAHFAMNIFSACAGLAGLVATYLEIRSGRTASAVCVVICTGCCLCFLVVFWALLLW